MHGGEFETLARICWPYDAHMTKCIRSAPTAIRPDGLSPSVWMRESAAVIEFSQMLSVWVALSAGRLVFAASSSAVFLVFLLKQTAAPAVLHLALKTLYSPILIVCLVCYNPCERLFRHQSRILCPISSVTLGSVPVKEEQKYVEKCLGFRANDILIFL